ncbi:hypothetical protein fugu_004437 [Takifugu bimaculatus]|uniref:SH3 domain-containing protein n=1 Tax=Takifugu bimaculatus TaxID=433685 RepID=A0A4Z2BCY6_9TELE|nr:hypothetical protein fugu_004437 [Takifugu bimaculatus]
MMQDCDRPSPGSDAPHHCLLCAGTTWSRHTLQQGDHPPLRGSCHSLREFLFPTPSPKPWPGKLLRECLLRVTELRKGISSVSGVTHCSLSTLMRRRTATTPHTARRRGASVDEFLRGSELGRQQHHHPHHHHHYSYSEEYHTESSRGSDLSDIMEEDEEELYSEMQLEEGRRRSINSHNTLKIIGNSPSHGSMDHPEHSGRRMGHIGTTRQQRPIPSIEITMDSNSEGSEGNLSPNKDDVYYGSVARRRIWRSVSSEDQYDGHGGRRQGRGRRSLDDYDESEPEELTRVFVALFDYDPMSMSPNPDAADEELPFKEGQIIKVFGNKDTDGFYRAEIRDRVGLIPCNMVSEIQTEDDEMMGQLLKQGFLPLNTPVEKLVNCDRFKDGRPVNRRSRKSKRERNRRGVCQYPTSHAENGGAAELTFCAGDVIIVFGQIDEDGFYYGELNGHKGLVPSNFLEEVPDDVDVYLTDSPSRYVQDTPARIKTKRVHAPSQY